MGIRRRILLSFFFLFAAVFISAAVVSTLLIAKTVERRLAAQTATLARLLSGKPGLRNATSLDFIRQAWGATSVTEEIPGTPVSGEHVFRAPLGPERELVMVYSSEVVSLERAQTLLPLASVAVAGLALVLLLGLLTAQALARPLERLAEQAKALPAARRQAGRRRRGAGSTWWTR